jgi:ectoine hydroxylase-related dioxygenase (phytanoyl-CoA dioxygenase family)
MMQPVFNSSLLQKEFDRNGYVFVGHLLDAAALAELRALFEKHKAYFEGPFHTSHFSDDVNYKQEVNNTIAKVVFEKAATLLHNYTPLFGNFMIKNPAPHAGMDLHADWTYVDETQHTSVAIWVPLIDVNDHNGCFGLIEGSHKVTNMIRGPLIRQSSRNRDSIWEKKYGKLMPMKAGDAIIYSHRLLHYSHPNKSNVVRPAINLSLVPASAPVIHYCMPQGTDEILLYHVPSTDFYIQYTHFQTPQTGAPVQTLPKDTVKYIDPVMEKFGWVRFKNRLKEFMPQ